MTARNAPPREGELVVVVEPHPEAGARGIVEKVYPANADYERRARVRFDNPYPGRQTFALKYLVAIR